MPDVRQPTRPFLTAVWRYLAMLNYEIDPAVLRPHVPRGTEVDTWQGQAFVSMVGFLFLDTRVLGVADPVASQLRGGQPALLRAAQRPGGRPARAWSSSRRLCPGRPSPGRRALLYGEKYVLLPMQHQIDDARQRRRPRRVSLASPRPAGSAWACDRWARPSPWRPAPRRSSSPSTTGATPAGAAERSSIAVEHPPWRVWQVGESWLECDVAGLYGPEFAPYLRGRPARRFWPKARTSWFARADGWMSC